MSKYTYAEIAESYNLWVEYVDPDAAMSESEFNDMSTEAKIALQIEAFGPEVVESGDDNA